MSEMPGPDLLTPREADVLELLQEGRSNAEIAVALHVGVETVRTHARNIYRKLGVRTRRDLASLGGSRRAAGSGDRRPGPGPDRALRRWLADAEAAGVAEPAAMVLATASPTARPPRASCSCAGSTSAGFAFFTNYGAPRRAIWTPTRGRRSSSAGTSCTARSGRAGPVERVSAEESDAYFSSRARGSRIGAWASPQSRVLGSRAELERLVAEAEARFPGEEIPRPPHWGGYRLRPETIEFWQGREAACTTGCATAGPAMAG